MAGGERAYHQRVLSRASGGDDTTGEGRRQAAGVLVRRAHADANLKKHTETQPRREGEKCLQGGAALLLPGRGGGRVGGWEGARWENKRREGDATTIAVARSLNGGWIFLRWRRWLSATPGLGSNQSKRANQSEPRRPSGCTGSRVLSRARAAPRVPPPPAPGVGLAPSVRECV